MRIHWMVIVGLSLASVASAETPRAKYTRKQNVVLEVKLSDRVKPIQPTSSKGRPITGTQAIRIEDKKVALRTDQEKILEQLVKDTPDDDPDKADLLFRLAEHYAKTQRYWRLKSVEAQTR